MTLKQVKDFLVVCAKNLVRKSQGLVQIHEKDDKKAKELTESLLEKFNLVHLRSVNAGVLSGGEAKRLSLARLMITNPKIVLIDEIWSMVDPLVVQDMQKL